MRTRLKMTDYEFQRGDIVMKIGERKKYLIKNVYDTLLDAIVMSNGCVVTGDKDEVARNYVKVGTWDFENIKEVVGDD